MRVRRSRRWHREAAVRTGATACMWIIRAGSKAHAAGRHASHAPALRDAEFRGTFHECRLSVLRVIAGGLSCEELTGGIAGHTDGQTRHVVFDMKRFLRLRRRHGAIASFADLFSRQFLDLSAIRGRRTSEFCQLLRHRQIGCRGNTCGSRFGRRSSGSGRRLSSRGFRRIRWCRTAVAADENSAKKDSA